MKGTCVTLKLNTLGVAHKIIEEKVKKGDFCIDATAGRGHDTAFLAELVGEEGRVIAFDIQQDAVDSTRVLLQEKGYQDRVEVFLDSHSNMDQYAEENTVDCITFNFGYLPGGDHALATKAETSIQALSVALSLLKKGGMISLCIYSGGDSGFEERDQILAWLKELDPHKYLVIKSDYYNRPNNPPIPVLVIKN